jgi:XTP/dITP diphosphohydrolase
MHQLAFATHNRHKLQEVAAKVSDTIELVSLTDLDCNEEIPETGTTFRENASIKSHYVADNYRSIVLQMTAAWKWTP